MTNQHGAPELIDIENVATAAVLAVLGPGSPVPVDTSGASFAPLALGDRLYVAEHLRRLIADVLEHNRPGAPGAVAPLTVTASLTTEASIKVRIESGSAWRELRLPLAAASPLDTPRLAQIQRYGFLRLAPLTAVS